MERKIGEIFEYNGEWYQCVKGNTCDECSFSKSSWNCLFDGTPYCSDRSDGIEVIFKKLEKVGEPYEFDGHLFQSYYTLAVPIFTENYATVRELGNNSKISIEIKQNKEDMEDLDKIKVRDYTKVEELNVMEEKKLNLKPFDIQKAREGKPVCTRDGRRARIICFDRKFYHDGYNYPIVAMVNDNDNELVHAYTQDGLLVGNKEGELDLMMLPEKKEGWVNVYKERIYSTKEEAIEATYDGVTYVDTIKISWEE